MAIRVGASRQRSRRGRARARPRASEGGAGAAASASTWRDRGGAATEDAERGTRTGYPLAPVGIPPVLWRDLGLDVHVLGLLKCLEALLPEFAPQARLLEAAEGAGVVIG